VVSPASGRPRTSGLPQHQYVQAARRSQHILAQSRELDGIVLFRRINRSVPLSPPPLRADQTPMMVLSVLDLLSPAHVPQLTRHLDALGYHRFWATEHHSRTQSASPTLVACLAAAMSSRMRIGTAGILLNYACPAKVAEDFRLLELYFAGRIDLGVAAGGGGAAGIADEALYLDGKPRPDRSSFAARVRALVDLVRGDLVGPAAATRPSLWLCGTSVSSGTLAGELGMQFACHGRGTGSSDTARAAIAAYRDAYRGPGSPYAVIAAYGTCAPTEAAARQLWPADAGSPSFVGTPSACADQLHTLISSSGAEEAVVHLPIHDIDARLAGYQLLAEAADLTIESDEAFDEASQ
jgi:alkanesulfonate monooxygenase SsuD/methylene tetrahydromethanopterin reductase-like flavin-dependent oxidoreductase (luciferase family)